MYEWLKRIIFPLLKIDEAEPPPPAGHDQDKYIQIIRASPSYLQYKLFYWKLYAAAWGLAVALVSGIVLAVDARFLWLALPLWVVAAGKAAVLYVVFRLDYEMRWYVITDRSLLIRQGVWIVREITLTFANAQNVRVQQGPVERWFGFSNLDVDTAGGGGQKSEKGTQTHQAVLRGLSQPEPVRDLILDRLRRHRTAGLGDPDDDRHAPPASPKLSPALLDEIWAEAKALRELMQKTVGG